MYFWMSFSGKNPEIRHCFAYMDSQYTEWASARNGGILVRVLYSGKQFAATVKCVRKFAAMFVGTILLSVEPLGVTYSLHKVHNSNTQHGCSICFFIHNVCL
jgi:hypothetical protein